MKVKSFLRSAVCALISFALVFYVIPVFFATGTADILWMALEVVFPALVAVVLLEQVRPVWVFSGLPVYYLLLVVLAAPLSRIWGCSIERALGWPEYIGTTFTWPLVVTVVQFYILRFRRKRAK